MILGWLFWSEAAKVVSVVKGIGKTSLIEKTLQWAVEKKICIQ